MAIRGCWGPYLLYKVKEGARPNKLSLGASPALAVPVTSGSDQLPTSVFGFARRLRPARLTLLARAGPGLTAKMGKRTAAMVDRMGLLKLLLVATGPRAQEDSST